MQYTVGKIADENKISEASVEKDWWVTSLLKVLFSLSPAGYMTFKGGTSLSKGWNLIDRFSEDIDISLHRDFYLKEFGKQCAKAETNNQIKNLRIINRDYIHGEFLNEFQSRMIEEGLGACKVVPIKSKDDGTPIDHDSDPVVIEVQYPVNVKSDSYVRPVVKIEISCLSMKDPFEVKKLVSMIGKKFPDIDDDTVAFIPTVLPTRTFLEKAFLLNEEYQRKKPRTERMSRHLYDLEKMMDTSFALQALGDVNLYNKIIAHRKKFYHVGGVNYELNNSSTIKFCPVGELREMFRTDYDVMTSAMIYGDNLEFENLIIRLQELESRFRTVGK